MRETLPLDAFFSGACGWLLMDITKYFVDITPYSKVNQSIEAITMSLNAGTLTFEEFAMREQLPLATIHDAVLEYLRGRDDVVVFGAQAVNAYVSEPRMSQDIDLLTTHADSLAEELRKFLSDRFHIAVRVRVIGAGKGYRLFQIAKPRNRHLVDVRNAASLPHAERIEDVLVISPPELIAHKVISYHARRG